MIDAREQAERANREAASSSQRSGLFSEQRIIVNIHEETNAVLASATRNKWAELRSLLDTLDKRQPQVLIETALIEISQDFKKDIGFEYANVKTPTGDTQRGFGFTSVGITTADNIGDARLPSPTAAGLTYGIFDGEDLGIPFIVQAAQTRDDANVLSVPSVLVSNNKGALVSSNDRVPYQTSNATQGTVASNFDFIDAGITLAITPSISAQRYLRLQVKLEVSSFRGDGANGAPPPVTSRKVETSVSLPDGATMWLGGIIRDDVLDSESGIPYLSDIPLIGFLFGRNTDRNIKTTLFFFCTPKIIEEFDELADVSNLGKARAAASIGLDRVQMIDPKFKTDSPVDVILEEGEGGNASLNLSGFAAPAYQGSGGEVPAGEIGGARLTPPKKNP